MGVVEAEDGVRVSAEPGDGRVYVACGYLRSWRHHPSVGGRSVKCFVPRMTVYMFSYGSL